ncbi:hypothetical protein ACFXNW_02875 [Nocardia sp. NPDC059180]|uniref:hypothetical protein n=1 Tax=Nocardia sp. NPDC059180 TaxID=3346761 RepID=UPI00367A44DC
MLAVIVALIGGQGANSEYTDVNDGVSYTSFELYGCCLALPKIATVFPDHSDRSHFMVYSSGLIGFDDLKAWWRDLPLGAA